MSFVLSLESSVLVEYHANTMLLDMRIFKKPLLAFSVIAITLFVVSALILVFNLKTLPESGLILQISAMKEIKQLGSKSDIVGIEIVGAIVLIINFILAETFFMRERILSFLLILANVLIALLALITIGFILSLN
ncbi:MAG: hypothetical protein Q8P01_01615 [bacterium]|nr:hypothetical protein [bacterium]